MNDTHTKDDILLYIILFYDIYIYTVTDRIMEKKTFQFTGAACL